MADYDLFQIEISKNYTTVEWRDDLKRLLLKAGCEAKPTCFLFSDNQIKDESFVEDINMILNTGTPGIRFLTSGSGASLAVMVT